MGTIWVGESLAKYQSNTFLGNILGFLRIIDTLDKDLLSIIKVKPMAKTQKRPYSPLASV